MVQPAVTSLPALWGGGPERNPSMSQLRVRLPHDRREREIMNAPQRAAARFIAVDFPPDFVLEVPGGTGRWHDEGLFHAAFFERQPDGAYLCAGHGGSPLWLRCLRQHHDLIDVVTG